MVSLTLSIPPELKQNMDKFSWVNWSGLARGTFSEKIEELNLLEKMKSKHKSLSEIRKLFEDNLKSDEDPTKLIRKMRDRRYEKW